MADIHPFPGGKSTPGIEENPNPTREDLVAEMNEQYCWLEDEHIIFDLRHYVMRNESSVRAATAHMFTREKVKASDGRERAVTVTAYGAWLSSPDRKRYSGRKLLPGVKEQFSDHDWLGRPLGGTYVNLWRGFGCEPIAGSVLPFKRLVIRLCGGNKKEAKHLILRIAIKIQKPWLKFRRSS
jgi:hypothetical protein